MCSVIQDGNLEAVCSNGGHFSDSVPVDEE